MKTYKTHFYSFLPFLFLQINVEVYGIQTRCENVSHDVKYHIKKEKSMFNLTPLKKMKKQVWICLFY